MKLSEMTLGELETVHGGEGFFSTAGQWVSRQATAVFDTVKNSVKAVVENFNFGVKYESSTAQKSYSCTSAVDIRTCSLNSTYTRPTWSISIGYGK